MASCEKQMQIRTTHQFVCQHSLFIPFSGSIPGHLNLNDAAPSLSEETHLNISIV